MFKNVSSKFQERFQGFSSKIDECFDEELRVFQGNSRVFGKFWVFGECLNEVYNLKYIKSLPKKAFFVVVV